MSHRPGFSIGGTRCKNKNGEWTIALDSPHRYQTLLARLNCERVTATIQKEVKHRSLAFNRAYWACVVSPISEHTGYESDEVHELLKLMCNPKVVVVSGEEKTIGGSTASMNNDDFSEYFRRCQKFAAETLDVYCPDPNEEHAFQ